MSELEIQELEIVNSEDESSDLVKCCDKHVLVNTTVSITQDNNINFLKIYDLNAGVELYRLKEVTKEKDRVIANLEKENVFLREQVKILSGLLDQFSVSMKNASTKNDIRIKVENSAGVSIKKWYRRPRIILSGSAIVVMFSIYLRYKIKYW